MATATTTAATLEVSALFPRAAELMDFSMGGFDGCTGYLNSGERSEPRLTTEVLNIIDKLPPMHSPPKAGYTPLEAVHVVGHKKEIHAQSIKKPVGRPKGPKKDNVDKVLRPLSGYNEYFKATHQDARKKLQNAGNNPTRIDQKIVTKVIGSNWKELSEDEKRIYNVKARKNKHEYQKAKEMMILGRARGSDDKANNKKRKMSRNYHACSGSNHTTPVACLKGRMVYYHYNVVTRHSRVNWHLDSTQFHLILSPNKVSCPRLGFYFQNGEVKNLLPGDSEW